MNDFLNKNRPPVFCPGCTHERITQTLNKAFVQLGLPADKIVIVTDIGCSGLFDTFFNVHALHGAHGRALTYATGLKLVDPSLHVIVTMGDGGLGIGGGHVLSACRRNLDITLIILNNFNFGMTGGQYSVTTPSDASVGSSFLNRAESPLEICSVAKAAGATYVSKCSGLDKNLTEEFVTAIQHKGFSLVETLGMCTGRYTKRNKLTPKVIMGMIEKEPFENGLISENMRPEYGEMYRSLAATAPSFPKANVVEKMFDIPSFEREEIMVLGSAGMRIMTAGDIICYAAISAGLHTSMKNDYNITVLRGQSISEILISREPISYPGSKSPSIILALSDEGVVRKKDIFTTLSPSTVILKEKSVTIPENPAQVTEIDFSERKIKRQDWALASLGWLAAKEIGLTRQMLMFSLKSRLKQDYFLQASEIIDKMF